MIIKTDAKIPIGTFQQQSAFNPTFEDYIKHQVMFKFGYDCNHQIPIVKRELDDDYEFSLAVEVYPPATIQKAITLLLKLKQDSTVKQVIELLNK